MFDINLYTKKAERVFLQETVDFEEGNFPAGEEHIRLTNTVKRGERIMGDDFDSRVVVTARLTNTSAVMRLALLVDALKRTYHPLPIELEIPYMPYARQDRACVKGEAHSLKVMAGIINSLGCRKVIVLDPHSTVTEAVLDNCYTVTQADIIASLTKDRPFEKIDHLVSPDAGAAKKTGEVAKALGIEKVVQANKVRNLLNGKIESIEIGQTGLSGTCLIVDDICEYGGTFILLAKQLRAAGAERILLWATHGTFGGPKSREQTVKNLLANGIDAIYTTDSYDKYQLPAEIKGFTLYNI